MQAKNRVGQTLLCLCLETCGSNAAALIISMIARGGGCAKCDGGKTTADVATDPAVKEVSTLQSHSL